MDRMIYIAMGGAKQRGLPAAIARINRRAVWQQSLDHCGVATLRRHVQ